MDFSLIRTVFHTYGITNKRHPNRHIIVFLFVVGTKNFLFAAIEN